MIYDSPVAFRQAIEGRLANAAREHDVSVQRLRRKLVFERIVIRLDRGEPGVWVVKGGMALEWRLAARSRATKDLDLALREDEIAGPSTRDRLIETLAADPDGDGFRFAVGPAERVRPDSAGRAGFRFSIEAALAGRRFEAVRLDIVARADEIQETERLLLSRFLEFANIPTGEVEVVTPRQHFVENLHAFTRSYGDRENSRVRDLADMVLLVEENLVKAPGLLCVAKRIFDCRRTHSVPETLPDPPRTWGESYSAMAAEIDLKARTLDEVMVRLREFWNYARSI
jgi:hypothetical protein